MNYHSPGKPTILPAKEKKVIRIIGPETNKTSSPDIIAVPPEPDDNVYLVDQGEKWLIKFMKMSEPILERSAVINGSFRAQYRDENGRFCVLKMEMNGDNIEPLFYSTSPPPDELFQE